MKGPSCYRRDRSPSPVDQHGDNNHRNSGDHRNSQVDRSRDSGYEHRSNRVSHRHAYHSIPRDDGLDHHSVSYRSSAGSPRRHCHSGDSMPPSLQNKRLYSARKDVASSEDERNGSLPTFGKMEPTPAVNSAFLGPLNEDISEIQYGVLRVVSLDITLLQFYQLVGRSSYASSSIEIPTPNLAMGKELIILS